MNCDQKCDEQREQAAMDKDIDMNKDIQQQPSRSHRAGQQNKVVYHRLRATMLDEYALSASKRAVRAQRQARMDRAVRAQRRARADREGLKALGYVMAGFIIGLVFMGAGGIF